MNQPDSGNAPEPAGDPGFGPAGIGSTAKTAEDSGFGPPDADDVRYATAAPASGPYPQWAPGYGYPPARPTNSMAIAALITGIVSLFSCPLIGAVAVYLGKRAQTEIQASGEDGDGLAKAGLILGWVAIGMLGLIVLGVVAYVAFLGVVLAVG